MRCPARPSRRVVLLAVLGLLGGCGAASTTPAPDDKSGELVPGRYCFQRDDEKETVRTRLNVDSAGKLSGDSRGTIHDQQAGYFTSYARKFTGAIAGNSASLEVSTWIEYDFRVERQRWSVDARRLTTDRHELTAVDCAAVDPAFKDLQGLEAADLLYSADAVRRQTLAIDAGDPAVTIGNSVIRGHRDVYAIAAQGGQSLKISVVSIEDNAVFDAVSPSGFILTMEAIEEDLRLPHTGTYQIIVGGTRGNATYELTVTLE